MDYIYYFFVSDTRTAWRIDCGRVARSSMGKSVCNMFCWKYAPRTIYSFVYQKNGEKVKKYELLGLFILVAIPLPGTGAWTGALVAALMDIRLKKSIPAIALGVVAAGLIVSALMYGVVGSIIGR